MLQMVEQFMADMNEASSWVSLWVYFMGALFLLSIPFAFTRVEARWIAFSTLIAGPVLLFGLYSQFGYQRILGLAHIIGWAPAVWAVMRRKNQWRVGETLGGKYIALMMLVMFTSLAIDSVDVVRYAMGERL